MNGFAFGYLAASGFGSFTMPGMCFGNYGYYGNNPDYVSTCYADLDGYNSYTGLTSWVDGGYGLNQRIGSCYSSSLFSGFSVPYYGGFYGGGFYC